jgi:hypothetical protein
VTKTNLATFDNDATGCYDRILAALAMIACRRLGVSTEAVLIQSITLLLMAYHLKTARGVSAGSYRSTMEDPIFGSGQGSCASPALWLAISILLIHALRLAGPGVTFRNPQGTCDHDRQV